MPAWPVRTTAADATTDHVHQKSLWFCHGDVIPEGLPIKTPSANKADKGVDFWSEAKDKDGKKRHGTIRCVKVEILGTGGEPVPGTPVTVVTWNQWLTADGEKIMDEKRTITFRETPQGRLFTFTCELFANDYPIVFGDTKEGSFGVRVHDDLRTVAKAGGTVTPSTAPAAAAGTKDNLPLWGQVADWNDYSGTVGGKAVGLAVFAHPSNPTKSAWHTRAYGLMAANPFGRAHSGFPSQKGATELVRIEKGKSLTYRFAAYAHTGDATAGKVAEVFEAFRK